MSHQIPANSVPKASPVNPGAVPPAPSSWYGAWEMAITRPSQATYSSISVSPIAGTCRTMFWILLSSLAQALALEFIGLARLEREEARISVISAFWAGVLRAALTTARFWLIVWLLNRIAALFGGHAPEWRVAFTIAAIIAPIGTLSAAVTMFLVVPAAGLFMYPLSLVLFLYMAILIVIAVKATHQIKWSGAVVSAIGAPAIVIVSGGALLYIIFRLGP